MDMIGGDASEWEYEYEGEETEDFYVVLELPAASTLKPKGKGEELFAAHDPTKPRKKAPRAGTKRRRAAADENANDEEEALTAPADPNDERDPAVQPNLLQGIQGLNLTALEKRSDDAPKGLQIMDLESDEPMIRYQGQIYSCQWASSIGSDLLFARRPEEPGPDYAPLHSFREVDMLAIGAAKLVASPALIERRQDFARQSDLDIHPADANLTIQNEELLRQAKFLGRIADIQASRGDQVGNLRTLVESVHRNPEMFGPDGKPLKRGKAERGRIGRGRPGRRRGRSAARRASAASRADATAASPTIATTASPTIATTRTRRASTRSVSVSTPTPVTWADLDDDDNNENA